LRGHAHPNDAQGCGATRRSTRGRVERGARSGRRHSNPTGHQDEPVVPVGPSLNATSSPAPPVNLNIKGRSATISHGAERLAQHLHQTFQPSAPIRQSLEPGEASAAAIQRHLRRGAGLRAGKAGGHRLAHGGLWSRRVTVGPRSSFPKTPAPRSRKAALPVRAARTALWLPCHFGPVACPAPG
jgi:hypothetical protein